MAAPPTARSPFVASASFTGWMVARAASILLLLVAAVAAQVPARFTLGDLRERVRQIQGTPSLIERLPSLGIERWSFGTSSVTFDPATGRVTGWSDRDRALRTTLRAAHAASDSVLTLGMPLGDVARLLGTPWAVTAAPMRHLLLAYGQSTVRIDAASRRVNGWVRRDGTLRVAPTDDPAAHVAMGAPMPHRGSTAASAPPPSPAPLALHFVGVADADGDGRLAPREFGDVTVRIRNASGQATGPLRAQVVHAPGLALLATFPDTLWIADLPPGDSTDVTVPVYPTGDARDPELTVLVWAGSTPSRLSLRVPTRPLTPAPAATVGASLPPVDVAPEGHARNPDAIAVLVGVEQYARLSAATFADRDAHLMRRYATRTLGVPDDATHLVVRTGAGATGSEVRRLLGDRGWLSRRTTPSSDLLVYFAGHGALGSNGVPHLLPADADPNYVEETGFDLHALFDRLARLPARSITVVIDACFSGRTRDGLALVAGTRAAVVSLEHPALVRPNMAVFVASRGSQAAGVLPAEHHGVFTYHMARALQGAADRDGDRRITVAELGSWVEREVASASATRDREQQPLTIARDTARVIARLAAARVP